MSPPILPALRPLNAIRARCLECCDGQMPMVRNCAKKSCALWPFRTGRRPDTATVQDAVDALTAASEGQTGGGL
jgi:hypothetical protein